MFTTVLTGTSPTHRKRPHTYSGADALPLRRSALRFTHHSIGHSHTRRGAEEPLLDQDSNASCPTNIYYINMSLGRSRHERERRANRHHFMHQECGLAIVAATRNPREPRGSNGPVPPNAHLAMTYLHMPTCTLRTRPGVPRCQIPVRGSCTARPGVLQDLRADLPSPRRG